MTYHLDFTEKANNDIAAHRRAGNKAVLNKLLTLFDELIAHPFAGTGKPEPLKHDLSGCWSRRINGEHRLIYEVSGDTIFSLSAKGHYKKIPSRQLSLPFHHPAFHSIDSGYF